jgi:hypothetical protein
MDIYIFGEVLLADWADFMRVTEVQQECTPRKKWLLR